MPGSRASSTTCGPMRPISPMPTARPCPIRCKKLVAYIRSHYREAVSLAALSELSGWSEGHICSQFKKEWGIGYMDLVNELRLKESLYLLLYRDDLTVKEIAGQVGI